MPFVPQFSEAGESEFIDKLMVVVHRDMKAALDYFDRLDHEGELVDNFADFAAMVRGLPDVFNYPLLTLAVERVSSQETESGEWLSQTLTAGAGMVVEAATVAAVHKKAEKYVRAFKAVLRKGVLEMLPVSSGLAEYTIDINHQYFRHGTKGTNFTQPVEFEIVIRFGEK